MKTAIFGGSFNPIHLGHLALAEEAVKIGYQRILFIPAGNPPHKTLAEGASSEQRLAMLKMAIEHIPWASIWEGELDSLGPSWTIHTIDYLREMNIISGRVGLIIGDDLLKGFSQWKDIERIVETTTILLAYRVGTSVQDSPYPHQKLNNPVQPHSSTQIRSLIMEGSSIESLVPKSIIPYILKNKLYGA